MAYPACIRSAAEGEFAELQRSSDACLMCVGAQRVCEAWFPSGAPRNASLQIFLCDLGDDTVSERGARRI